MVSGYSWKSVLRDETRDTGGVRGSGEVAVLFRSALTSSISVARRDVHARYLWLRFRRPSTRDLFIAICYFPLETSHFTWTLCEDTGVSPYLDLYSDIVEFFRRGELLLVGDFNARTSTHQTSLLDFHSDPVLLPEMDTEDLGFPRSSANSCAPVTAYG